MNAVGVFLLQISSQSFHSMRLKRNIIQVQNNNQLLKCNFIFDSIFASQIARY